MRWTCESISTTESTSSTATIVTNNIESKEQCNVKLSIFLKFIQRANEYSAPLVRMSELTGLKLIHLALMEIYYVVVILWSSAKVVYTWRYIFGASNFAD